MKDARITEYWLSPRDEYGDALDVFFVDSVTEAREEYHYVKDEFAAEAKYWTLEKVVRTYESDGEMTSESITDATAELFPRSYQKS